MFGCLTPSPAEEENGTGDEWYSETSGELVQTLEGGGLLRIGCLVHFHLSLGSVVTRCPVWYIASFPAASVALSVKWDDNYLAIKAWKDRRLCIKDTTTIGISAGKRAYEHEGERAAVRSMSKKTNSKWGAELSESIMKGKGGFLCLSELWKAGRRGKRATMSDLWNLG